MTLADAYAAANNVAGYLQGLILAQQPASQPPQPLPGPIAQAGHEVTQDPPYSATAIATVFGLNWNGSNDSGDLDPTQADGNSRGFFIDPSTGSAYITHVKNLSGVSLPREVLLSTFLQVDAWQSLGIDEAWRQYAADLREWVLEHQPTLDIDSGGKYTVLNRKLVDAGPTASTGNGVDLTYQTAHDLMTYGSALVTYRINLAGSVIAIRGWDFVRKRVSA